MKIRLQRYMADCGVAARRECESMIESGRVKVNDEVVRTLPVFVDPAKDIVSVDESVLTPATVEGEEKVYFLLNKPKGILVTNFDPSERKTVSELMPGVTQRVFPVGRLDMDSRGALIMTNDGDLANRLTHPRYGVEKTYIVEVEGRMTPEDVERVKRGTWLGPNPGAHGRRVEGARTDRFHVKILGRERGRTILEVQVAESKNREIRRVMARIGHPVRDLNRVAIAERITIRNLQVGAFRPLSPREVEWLFQASSQEHHDKARAATQEWYEKKEMEKERRRLDDEAAAQREAAERRAAEERRLGNAERQRRAASAGPGAQGVPFKRSERVRKERPIKKGKKPFVPPTGRNAGKLLGGTKLGRKNFQKLEAFDGDERPEANEDRGGRSEAAPKSDGVQHPLGKRARSEE